MESRNVLIALGVFFAVLAITLSTPLKSNGKVFDVSNMKARSLIVRPHGKPIHKPVAQQGKTEYKKGTESFAQVCGRSVARSNASNYIVGGDEAVPHSWPWSTALLGHGEINGQEFDYFCTSTLISDRYILTAAHCVDIATSATLVLGSHDLTENESSRVIVSAKRLIYHPQWDPDTLHNDIGLIELEESVEFTDELRPVCLPSYDDASEDLTGETVTGIGWGLTSTDGDGVSPVLNQIEVPVISNEECDDIYGIISDEHMCTDSTGPKSLCFGDSGGSINYEKSDGKIIQVGVNSFIGNSCESELPNGETRVSSFLEFIETETGIEIEGTRRV